MGDKISIELERDDWELITLALKRVEEQIKLESSKAYFNELQMRINAVLGDIND